MSLSRPDASLSKQSFGTKKLQLLTIYSILFSSPDDVLGQSVMVGKEIVANEQLHFTAPGSADTLRPDVQQVDKRTAHELVSLPLNPIIIIVIIQEGVCLFHQA